ncbi:hypothetical protein B0G38_000861 [Arthrobacter sp. VKM Ac-2550]|nr:hypothetical protein [Arthrobacter sp. VKM Ac-2550]
MLPAPGPSVTGGQPSAHSLESMADNLIQEEPDRIPMPTGSFCILRTRPGTNNRPGLPSRAQ